MNSWSQYKSRITASVRTTNRINALLNESIQERRNRKFVNLKLKNESSADAQEDTEELKPKIDIEYLKNYFPIDHVYKAIEVLIDERMQWDRFNRVYDPFKAMTLASSLATEIKDRVKLFRHKGYRIVCITSIIEKRYQGVHNKMEIYMNDKLDNFTSYVHERATFYIVVTVFLVHKKSPDENEENK